jgi:hypothetical protein
MECDYPESKVSAICEKLCELMLMVKPDLKLEEPEFSSVREEAFANVDKFGKATEEYLLKINGLRLPACYGGTLTKYLYTLALYDKEKKMGICERCSVRIGKIIVESSLPEKEKVDIPII